MVLRVQRERIHVNAHGGDVGVVLVRLHQVEVGALALREPVVAVQLDLGHRRGVLARQALHAGNRVARLLGGPVPPVRVVEGLLTLPHVHRVVARHEVIALHHPDQLLARVVERHLNLVRRRGHRLIARELQLLNQVLVGHLGEAAALLRVQVDVVHEQRRRHQAGRIHAVHEGGVVGPAQVLQLLELQVHLHLVVLQRNQRQRQARVAVEPELQRDVQRVLRGA